MVAPPVLALPGGGRSPFAAAVLPAMSLVVVFLASFGQAYCPNKCSGHGSCGGSGPANRVGELCTCYTRREVDAVAGTNEEVAAWTGADCSKRTCPRGQAWAAAPQDHNDHTQRIECSGNGECDRATGQCRCYGDYVGDSCQRNACANNCGGHGICRKLKELANDYSHNADDGLFTKQFAVPSGHPNTVVYVGAQYIDAWDAEINYGCWCDEGWRGADCTERECPSGPDPMGGKGDQQGLDCSGRGVCDHRTGLCQCFDGYFGTACEDLNVRAIYPDALQPTGMYSHSNFQSNFDDLA